MKELIAAYLKIHEHTGIDNHVWLLFWAGGGGEDPVDFLSFISLGKILRTDIDMLASIKNKKSHDT